MGVGGALEDGLHELATEKGGDGFALAGCLVEKSLGGGELGLVEGVAVFFAGEGEILVMVSEAGEHLADGADVPEADG